MKLFLIIAAILIVGASLFADYKWRQWIARHRRDRDIYRYLRRRSTTVLSYFRCVSLMAVLFGAEPPATRC